MLIGVVTGTPGSPRVMPVEHPLEVTQEILALAAPASPSEVFRFASPCRGSCCPHFSTGACQIAARSVVVLSEVSDEVPYCSIRARCRWFRQEGTAICKRCPQIVTEQYAPTADMLRIVDAADPPSAATAQPPP